MLFIAIIDLLMNSNQFRHRLPKSYYLNIDVVHLAKDLLGKVIYTKINHKITSGIIIETEAYKSINDKASHAYLNKRTSKNKNMYQSGGIAYVYLCYGIHCLLNIVTNKENIADAVLIRAIEPKDGIEIMESRISRNSIKTMTSGPGKLSKALGVDMSFNGKSLTLNEIWIEDQARSYSFEIEQKQRIGIEYAEEDKKLPWRFYIKNNKFVSVK